MKSVQLIDLDLEMFKSILKKAVATVLQESFELLLEHLKRPSDEYLSRKEAAEFLKVSETTLWNLDKTQVLPAKRLNGKVLYLKSELLNLPNQEA
jgi:hypothetical protein